ncbi:MAG: M23 family metallopeptidase [Candidatus Krumholzibacteriota bacterium]|nr:M23 family metallopeptidase [Candidatus Krumholzibacteriota bacterium]
MHERIVHSFSFVMLLVLLPLALGCTPSPKYRGSTSSGQRRTEERSSGTANDSKIGIAFSAPLRNYKESRITSRFGLRRDPRYNREEFHYGVDIKARAGEEVLAAAAGTVTFAGRQRGFGKLIIIDHGGRVSTVYGHLSNVAVKMGESVKVGTVIGTVGRTGNATGVHLHFEIRKEGKALDPLDYI